MYKIICVAYIAVIVGMTIGSVGKMPVLTAPYNWSLPLIMFFLLATPAVVGYLAGRESK